MKQQQRQRHGGGPPAARAERHHVQLGKEFRTGKSLSWSDAITRLTGYPYGYGQASARGLLILADKYGTWPDGSTIVTSTAGRYTVGST